MVEFLGIFEVRLIFGIIYGVVNGKVFVVL